VIWRLWQIINMIISKKMYGAHDTIASTVERLSMLYASATVGSPSLDGMPKTQLNPHRFDDKISNIMDIQNNIDTLSIRDKEGI